MIKMLILQGAYAGLLSGVVFGLWIAIGAHIHKPYVYRPPIQVYGCNWNISGTDHVVDTSYQLSMNNVTTETPIVPKRYKYEEESNNL